MILFLYILIQAVITIMITEKLRAYLTENNISLSTLSRKTGLPIPYLNDCLNGKIKIKASDFIAICKALNLDIDFFR